MANVLIDIHLSESGTHDLRMRNPLTYGKKLPTN